MKRKLIAAVGVAAMSVSIAACGGSDDTAESKAAPKDRKETVTVWLMGETRSTWPELVTQTNAEFKKKYPNVKVKVQYQDWGTKIQKLDAALSGDSAPDIVEFGNTETTTYLLNGVLAEVDKSKYENSDTWLKGLEDSCTYEGKVYCVPFYASSRLALYNTDVFKKAGAATFPATEDELKTVLDKIADQKKADKAYSPLYLPGRYWYAAMSYVKGYGGEIAKYDDGSKKWTASLSTPEAQQGIDHFVNLVKTYNKADKTKDEQDHAAVAAQEKTPLLYGLGWEADGIVNGEAGNKKLDGKIATAGMPGPNGKALPSFMGGSDIGIVNKSKVQDLATEWLSTFTNAKGNEVLASKDILPNNTKQLEPLKDNPVTAAQANAVPDAWFTPIAPGWAAVEKQNVLEDMLVSIITGKKSTADATKEADEKINKLINEAA